MHCREMANKDISKTMRDDCLDRCEVYRDWLLQNVFEADSEETITVMVLPIEHGKPNYRDSIPP
jgi:hypothetical protein